MSEEYKQASGFVAGKLARLQAMTNEGGVKATLANLRRGVGRRPGELPELWGTIFQGMPESALSSSGEPTRFEWAVYGAMTLYAVHQQGRDPLRESMNLPGQTLGIAVRKLAPGDDEDTMKRVLRRFNAAATAGDMEELTHYLRGLVQLLRASGIGLDYPELTKDLYLYQVPSQTASVRLRWGQDFYRIQKAEETAPQEERKDD